MENNELAQALANEGQTEAQNESEPSNEELWSRIVESLITLETSIGSLHVTIRSLNNRVSTLENFVSYLLTNDPKAGPKMKELAEKAKAAAETEKADEELLSALSEKA